LYYASLFNNPSNDLSRWQKAADDSKAVIDLGIYDLYPYYTELFTEKGGYRSDNKEIIWARTFNHLLEAEVYLERRIYPNGSMGHGHFPPIQNLIDDYEMLIGKVQRMIQNMILKIRILNVIQGFMQRSNMTELHLWAEQ